MGRRLQCNRCLFTFYGGQNHHAGYGRCLCTSCRSRFVLPTRSEWGPQIGEEIEIGRLQRKLQDGWRAVTEIKPTGIRFRTRRGNRLPARAANAVLGDQPSRYDVEYPIGEIDCPDCGEPKLVMGFVDGDACPKCSRGTMKISAAIY